MTEHTLLYIIAIAGVLNVLAWIVVMLVGLHMYKEITKLRQEMTEHIRAVVGEIVPLLNETRQTLSSVRGVTESGKRIAEQIATAVVFRRVSPQWFPKKSSIKTGLGVLREGLQYFRKWLRSRNKKEADGESVKEMEITD